MSVTPRVNPTGPRVITVVILVGSLALANRFAPGMLQAILALVVLYLVVTHGGQVNRAITGASGNLARAYRGTR